MDGATLGHAQSLFLFNALPMLQGAAAGTYFTHAYDNPDRVKKLMGVGGLGYYVTTGDLSATMTMVVLPNSEENDILNAALVASQAAPNGLRYPYLCKQGLTIYSGFCRVAGEPPLEYSDVGVTRSWKLITTRSVGKMGGALATPIAGA